MTLGVPQVFDEYPNPFYIVQPLIQDGRCEDFIYHYVNDAFCRLVGHTKEELTGHRFLECFQQPGEDQWLRLFAEMAMGGGHAYVNTISTVIGQRMYTEAFHIDPDLCGCITHDFEAAVGPQGERSVRELRQRANCDFLTGFYNRYFLREVQDQLANQGRVGVSYLDINDLKHTNDSQGHAAGDGMILRLAKLLRAYYPGSMIFRMGGDEFLVVTTDVEREDFLTLSQKTKEVLELDGLAAIGYAYYETVEDLRECIVQCDSKMYIHKRQMRDKKENV
jgi:diguanylate cyclase (GGDEF)-like protein